MPRTTTYVIREGTQYETAADRVQATPQDVRASPASNGGWVHHDGSGTLHKGVTFFDGTSWFNLDYDIIYTSLEEVAGLTDTLSVTKNPA